MKKTIVRYRFEGVEDYASFLEHIISNGYELSMLAEGYQLDILSEGRFHRGEFVSKYKFLQAIFIFHKTKGEIDCFGDTVKSWAARSTDMRNGLDLWDVGGALETLIQDYISGNGNSL